MSDNIRVIHFPSDQSLGLLSVVDCRHYGEEWEVLGPAQGIISIPGGTLVKLTAKGLGKEETAHFLNLSRDALVSLDLSNCSIGNAALCHIGHLTSLRELTLDRNPGISDEGLLHLKSLLKLESLTLGFTSISDLGIAVLSRMRRLQIVSVGFTNITDIGVVTLSCLPRLQWLWLTNTRTTDSGVERLVGLESLAWLRLTGTVVTDRCIPSLGRCTGLRWLWVGNTEITERGRHELKRLLPGCEVKNE